MANNYHVFISHSWQNSDSLIRLRDLLQARGYFNVEFEEVSKDESINSINASYIKSRLSEKIRNSNIVLGLAGIYASYSNWMEWELDKALELGVPIVGVVPRGQERISSTVSMRSVEVVYWNTESIIDAIRRNVK